MGNRGGALHNSQREIVRQFKNHRWIICLLEFKGRKREVMSPGRYTELFFLDEAVAFAAGHRPCAECRRDRYRAFQEAWTRTGAGPASANDMDLVLHRTRIDRQGGKVTHQAALDSLPDGCFMWMEEASWLVWGDGLLRWSPEGYTERRSRQEEPMVTVLTPAPLVECLRNGYRPEVKGLYGSALAM